MTERDRKEEMVTLRAGFKLSRRWHGMAAAGMVAVAGTLAIAALHRPAADRGRYTVVEVVPVAAVTPADPLRAELLRCRTLAPGVDDLACRAAWDESRRRFFDERASAAPTSTPARER